MKSTEVPSPQIERRVQPLIVSHNPGRKLPELVAVLTFDGFPPLVVDNGSQEQRHLDRCRDIGACVVRLPENVGISGGLGLGAARIDGADWLLTFDQDSVISPGFVKELLDDEAANDPGVAVVAPVIVDDADGYALQSPSAIGNRVSMAMTSGSMTRMTALGAVGGFREDLFMDHVDHDLCLRLRRAGYEIAIARDVVMRHSVGRMRSHRVLGMHIRTSHHVADRQYYRVRNFLLLVRDGTARVDPMWTSRTAVALTLSPFKILLLERDKRAKCAAVAIGFWHGLLGRSGARPQAAT